MHPKRLIETNPVFALDALLSAGPGEDLVGVTQLGLLDAIVAELTDAGVGLPRQAILRWREEGALIRLPDGMPPEPRLGVVGLIADPFRRHGYVVPILATRAANWRVGENLPSSAEQVLDVLGALLACAPGVCRKSFAEARGVHLTTTFHEPSKGDSMELALTLAALGALHPTQHHLLRSACVVARVAGDRIAPVGHVPEKLDAFVREQNRGTLLIRAASCPSSSQFDSRFDCVWQVEDVDHLANLLDGVGLFDEFHAATPLDHATGLVLLARLQDLADRRHDHRAVVSLCDRLLAAEWLPEVPLTTQRRARHYLASALRHLGSMKRTLAETQAWVADVAACGDSVSLEDEAKADLELAASLFDPGRFEEAVAILERWARRIEQDPRALAADSRSRIWNTLARCLSVLGREGWRELFAKSLDLQIRTEPGTVARTRNYLAHSLLRAGDLDAARAELTDRPSAMHDAWHAFLRADLARRSGEVWTDGDLEQVRPGEPGVHHVHGLYFQATARQEVGREERATRLHRAEAIFLTDAEACDEDDNVLWVLVRLMQLARARALDDPRGIERSVGLLRSALARPGSEALYSFVTHVIPTTASPDPEPLMELLPWL